MNDGRLIAVVGPSGVGKDSVMAGLVSARLALKIARRVITRAPEAGGEVFDAVSEADFARARDGGAFALHWGAHGLFYAIPTAQLAPLASGQDVLVNLSRNVLGQAHSAFPNLRVLALNASADVLAARLAGRGRESGADIAARLARTTNAGPAGLRIDEVWNDGPLEQTIAAALAVLYPVRA